MRTWVRRLQRALSHQPLSRPKRAVWRPNVEALEDRSVPSASPLLSSFPGLDSTQSAFGAAPSHASVAVGLSSIMETDDSNLEIFNKSTGLPEIALSLADLFGSGNVVPYDAKVMYSPSAQRFVVFALEQFAPLPYSSLVVAVSNTSDPTQGFGPAQFVNTTELDSLGAGLTPSSLQVGTNGSYFVATMNMIEPLPGGGSQALHVDGVAIPATMLFGSTPFNVQAIALPASDGVNIVPANELSPDSGLWFVQEYRNQAGNPSLALARVTAPANQTPNLQNITVVSTFTNLPNDYAPNSAPQPGGGGINVGDDSVNSVTWYDGKLAFTRTAGILTPAGLVDRAELFVVNTSGATPTLQSEQFLTAGSAATATYDAAAAFDYGGNLNVTFDASSATQPASMYVAVQPNGGSSVGPAWLVVVGTPGYSAAGGLGQSAAVALDPVSGIAAYAVNTVPSPGSSAWQTQIANLSANAGASANKNFVDEVYWKDLGRPADLGGETYWVNVLASGSTRAQVLQAMLGGIEYRDDLVESWYQRYLGRAADASGLAYWSSLLNTQNSVAIQEQFVVAAYGSLYNSAFVQDLYQNILGRLGGPSEVTFWANLLNAQKISRGQMVYDFLTSQEYTTKEVSAAYLNYLGRAADPNGLAGWVSVMEKGTSPEQLTIDFETSTEFANLPL